MSDLAVLAVEDGTIFRGRSFGAVGAKRPGILANLGSTAGLAETLTDPAVADLILSFSYPHIGIGGVVAEDAESDAVHAAGVVCAEASRLTSNWRGGARLDEYLRNAGVPAMDGVDARRLARFIYGAGKPLRAVLASGAAGKDPDADALVAEARALPAAEDQDWRHETRYPPPAPYEWTETWQPLVGEAMVPADPGRPGVRKASGVPVPVTVIDLGVKKTLLRLLASSGAKVTVVPPSHAPDAVLGDDPAAVVFSSGPGYPETCRAAMFLAQGLLMSGRTRLWGMGLGAGVLALACGAKTFVDGAGRFGGIGVTPAGKSPVSDNHGWMAVHAARFGLDGASLAGAGLEPTWLYPNGGGVAGFARADGMVRGEVFVADATPGPREARRLFADFFGAFAG